MKGVVVRAKVYKARHDYDMSIQKHIYSGFRFPYAADKYQIYFPPTSQPPFRAQIEVTSERHPTMLDSSVRLNVVERPNPLHSFGTG